MGSPERRPVGFNMQLFAGELTSVLREALMGRRQHRAGLGLLLTQQRKQERGARTPPGWQR